MPGGLERLLLRVLCVLAFTSVLAGCAGSIRPVLHGPDISVDSEPDAFLLAQNRAREATGLPGLTLLNTGQKALLARAALIETASQRIDAQYYIWNNDASGRYLASRLLAASERGVVVRLLLDDINVSGNEPLFAQLDAHPNIQVRIFNPISAREGFGQWLSFITDFDRINRRMHNKTFVVDGQVGIAGGRNIGDEYFDQHPTLNFRDRDVMVLGDLAGDMTRNFEVYWNSPWTLPLSGLYQSPEQAEPVSADLAGKGARNRLQAQVPTDRAEAKAYLESLFAQMVSAPAELVFDPPPENPEAPADKPKRTAEALFSLLDEVQSEILIESAYLILTDDQLHQVSAVEERNVKVAALTNSLASNDLVTNHSGYARWRGAMLERGMELHELRPDARDCELWMPAASACSHGGVSLHSKAVVLDRKTLFIGSFNVNLRSIYLNGETALVIRSPELASAVARDIRFAMEPGNSWQVQLDSDGDMVWRSGDLEVHHEPEVGLWRRTMSRILSWLPIEKYL